jgi:eukaryotic-like serine/threonine-protein kinase
MTGDSASGGYTLSVGQTLGQYRIVRPLGRGGMGEVYEAEHQVLRRSYALKLLPADFAAQSGALERFQREAQVMANLEHPNILKVDDFGETNGRYWLRMELADGVESGGGKHVVSLQDLADAGGGKIGQDKLADILRQILEGLKYAHDRGAIHRDLKPSNILFSGGVAKIADFGLVRLVGEDWVRSQAQLSVQRSMSLGDARTMRGESGSTEGTSTRSLLGTFEYMSPEQKHGEDATAQSDLYAVGLMAYRLLTGRNLGPKLPSRIDSSLASAWDDFVEGALEEDAEERPATAEEALKLLDACGCIGGGDVDSPVEIQPQVVAGASAGNKIRTVDLGGGVGLDLVWVPPGEFLMGSPQSEIGRDGNEGPQHRVTISKGFWMGKYPVTQGQYQGLMGQNPSHRRNAGLDAPVEMVSWRGAQVFCGKLLSASGLAELISSINNPTWANLLPTEAEWEYACRAGSKTALYTGRELTSAIGPCRNLDEIAWYGHNSGSTTKPVGQKQPNGWGLYDMLGNVWEWCADAKRTDSSSAAISSASTELSCVLRGGSWYTYARSCRAACRSAKSPDYRLNDVGFRVVVR